MSTRVVSDSKLGADLPAPRLDDAEEIGMKNAPADWDLSEFIDVGTVNCWAEIQQAAKEEGKPELLKLGEEGAFCHFPPLSLSLSLSLDADASRCGCQVFASQRAIMLVPPCSGMIPPTRDSRRPRRNPG